MQLEELDSQEEEEEEEEEEDDDDDDDDEEEEEHGHCCRFPKSLGTCVSVISVVLIWALCKWEVL